MPKEGCDPFDRPDSSFNTLENWTWIGCYGGYYLQSDLDRKSTRLNSSHQ